MRTQFGTILAAAVAASFTSGTATADNFRVVPANPLYLFKVVDGKVRLSCINGTQILFR